MGWRYSIRQCFCEEGIGIDELLDADLLQAEVLELKETVKDGMASSVVIESYLDKVVVGGNRIGTISTLNRGDIVLCGLEYGRHCVRCVMKSARGESAIAHLFR